MAREIRVTFTDKEEDLYNYIVNKSSKTAFLKDLASIEKKREENYINSSVENKVKEIAEEIVNILGTQVSNDTVISNQDENENNNEYDFDIDDLGLDK